MAATSPHDVGDEVNPHPLNQEALRWLKVANFPPAKPVAQPALAFSCGHRVNVPYNSHVSSQGKTPGIWESLLPCCGKRGMGGADEG